MGVDAVCEFNYITHSYPYGRGPHHYAPHLKSHVSMVTPPPIPHGRYFAPFAAAMTPRVVTLWYRAPEVLMGADVYDEAIDMQVEGGGGGEEG